MSDITDKIKRRVIIEKHTNYDLYIYTRAINNRGKGGNFLSIEKQKEQGLFIAHEYGLNPIEYNESYIFERGRIMSFCKLNLLKLVLIGKVKYVYINDLKLISYNRTLRNYVLHFYKFFGVILFVKSIRYPLEKLCITVETEKEIEELILMINENVRNKPFEYMNI